MRTTLTAMLLFGAYVVYAKFTGALLKPNRKAAAPWTQTEQTSGTNNGPREHREKAIRYLPLVEWAEKARFRLRHKNMYFYCGNRTQSKNRRSIRFEQFAIIWMDENDESKHPVTIVADNAEVTFEKETELTDIQPELIAEARMQGKVHITGPDGLEVTGTNFIFERASDHIRSDHPVRYQYGPHFGTADTVEIDLTPDPDAELDRKLSYIGVKTLTLRRNIAVSLQYDEKLPSAVVRSPGSFTFDFESSEATLLDNIHIHRESKPGLYDSVQCDKVVMQFEKTEEPVLVDESENDTDRDDGNKKSSETSGEFRLKTLVANGRQVILKSQENQLRAYLKELQYDGPAKTFTLLADQSVRAFQENNELVSRSIQMTHDDNGDVVSGRCIGPGRFWHRDENGKKIIVETSWKDTLTFQPDHLLENGLRIVELSGTVMLKHYEEQAGLLTDRLKVWLLEESKPNSRQTIQMTGGRSDSPTSALEDLVVKRILATGRVSVVSPDVDVETNELDVLVEKMPDVPGSSVKLASHERKENAVLTPFGQMSSRLNGGPSNPLNVAASIVTLSVKHNATTNAVELNNLNATRNVVMTQPPAKDRPGVTITGRDLTINNVGDERHELVLIGSPAKIVSQEFMLQGPKITFNQEENRARVHGDCLLQIPLMNSISGKKLSKPQLMNLWCHDHLVFDGHTAHFVGRVHGTLPDGKLSCEELIAELDRRLSFTERKQDTKDIKINKITCKDKVQVDLFEYDDQQKMTDMRQAHAWKVELNQQTGETKATGPGWLSLWRRGSQQRISLSRNKPTQPNRALSTKKEQWNYMRIDFAGEMTGNINERTGQLKDRVHVLYGPVKKPLDVLDRDHLPDYGGTMDCEILTFLLTRQEATRDKKERDWLELTAEKNAFVRGQVEGQMFRGQADIITFNEASELFTFRAKGEATTTIWHRENPGDAWNESSAKLIKFSPTRRIFETDRTDGISGGR